MKRKRRILLNIFLIILILAIIFFFLIATRIIILQNTPKPLDIIDSQLQEELNELFSDDKTKVVIMPKDGSVEIKKGQDPAGFAFSIYNTREESGEFYYEVEYVRDSCGMGIDGAEELLEYGEFPTGTLSLGSGSSLDSPIEIYFQADEDTPLCSVEYLLTVEKDGEPYFSGEQLFVRIK